MQALSAFVVHSDAAKRLFVTQGGLEAIFALVSKPLRTHTSGAGPGPGSMTYLSDYDDDEDPGGGLSNEVGRTERAGE